ncbi:MAG: cupin domain-containing protein [Bacteroidetes bacterium]|nr:cupin domain-containing protein [Bacteroidota bacterium]
MQVISLKEKFSLFSEYFSPKIIGELNGQHVKLGKFKGEFVWHSHENEDEMFLVVKGKFFMDLRDKTLEINEGEMIIIPKGVEHRPRSTEEVHVMLFEPAGTLNTGNINNELTRSDPERI